MVGFTETENRAEVARVWGEGPRGSSGLNKHRAPAWGDGRVLETDAGDGRAAM